MRFTTSSSNPKILLNLTIDLPMRLLIPMILGKAFSKMVNKIIAYILGNTFSSFVATFISYLRLVAHKTYMDLIDHSSCYAILIVLRLL